MTCTDRLFNCYFRYFLNEGMDIFRITCLFLVCQDINTCELTCVPQHRWFKRLVKETWIQIQCLSHSVSVPLQHLNGPKLEKWCAEGRGDKTSLQSVENLLSDFSFSYSFTFPRAVSINIFLRALKEFERNLHILKNFPPAEWEMGKLFFFFSKEDWDIVKSHLTWRISCFWGNDRRHRHRVKAFLKTSFYSLLEGRQGNWFGSVLYWRLVLSATSSSSTLFIPVMCRVDCTAIFWQHYAFYSLMCRSKPDDPSVLMNWF